MPFYIYLAAAAAMSAIPLMVWLTGGNNNRYRSATLSGNADLRTAQLARGRYERLFAPLLDRLSGRLGRLAPTAYLDKLDRKLTLAGMGHSWTTGRLLAVKTILGAAGAVLGFLYVASGPSTMRLISAIGLTVFLFQAMDLSINSKAKERQKLIQRELPDILDQITITVEAGLGFDAALDRVAKQADGPLATELGRTIQDVQLGVAREEALENLLERTDAPDLKQFVIALNQAAELGMPLGRVLRVQSSELRIRRKARAEEMAYKIGVKLSFPTVTCILPSLLIVVMGPAIIEVAGGGLEI